MKMTRNTHRWLGVQNSLFYLLLFVVFGLLAYLSQWFIYRADWTDGNRNSLTPPTIALLKALDAPLQFVAYIPDTPALQDQIRQVVDKYQQIKSDVTLEFVNPDLEPERAKADGIAYSGQLLLQLGEKKEIIESSSEAVIVSALSRLSRETERLIVFIEGHNERQPLWTESVGMSTLVEILERTGFKVVPHNLLRTQSLPQNASFIVLAAPQKPLLEGEVTLLVDYVKQGGNILWLHDPAPLQGLAPLATLLGLQVFSGTVVDANENLQRLLGIKHPAVVPVVDYNSNSPITKGLQTQTLFPFATMITPDPHKTATTLPWEITPFLSTLPQSWLETSELSEQVVYNDMEGDQAGPINIGVSLTRTIAAKENTPARQQRIAVIGDSDFMLNAFIGMGGNQELAQQLFNWLSEDDTLLQVTLPRAPDTQFAMDERLSIGFAVFFLLLLPLSLLAIGVGRWWYRRRR